MRELFSETGFKVHGYFSSFADGNALAYVSNFNLIDLLSTDPSVK